MFRSGQSKIHYHTWDMHENEEKEKCWFSSLLRQRIHAYTIDKLFRYVFDSSSGSSSSSIYKYMSFTWGALRAIELFVIDSMNLSLLPCAFRFVASLLECGQPMTHHLSTGPSKWYIARKPYDNYSSHLVKYEECNEFGIEKRSQLSSERRQ